jgi:hypothetical protein
VLNIINIRGTNGSGKSTVVRRVMERYSAVPVYRSWRKRPIGYACKHPSPAGNTLWVPGHYETPCGGCDTITTVADAYEEVERGLEEGYDVLFEGIMSQDNQQYMLNWAAQKQSYQILVIGLTTSIADCITGITYRRLEKGNPKPLDPKNTIARERSVRNNLARLQQVGIDVRLTDRDTAVKVALVQLGFSVGLEP